MSYRFLLLLIAVCSSSLFGRSSWSTDLYDKFDEKSFAAYPPALERIDMDHIDFPLLHAAVFYETNRIRKLHQLPEFHHSNALEQAARKHSLDMVNHNFYSHTSPVKGKTTLTERAAVVGIRDCELAENISELSGLELVPNQPLFPPDQGQKWFSYEYRARRFRIIPIRVWRKPSSKIGTNLPDIVKTCSTPI
ncbi:MAG: CAP domain-containing protein [candidate division KSB1 bacterium]|nr:CAP domain-containing protein [candidate division KSB1 bacterium]